MITCEHPSPIKWLNGDRCAQQPSPSPGIQVSCRYPARYPGIQVPWRSRVCCAQHASVKKHHVELNKLCNAENAGHDAPCEHESSNNKQVATARSTAIHSLTPAPPTLNCLVYNANGLPAV